MSAVLPGFAHFPTHHCVTGSMRHIYAFHQVNLGEEMLLGLGEGVGFIYWHMRGSLPFLGGRANVGRPGEPGMEVLAGQRTGVAVQITRTGSAARAEKNLLQRLRSGEPVMLMLDMGFLPYFDFGGSEFHFGYHVVVACGLDEQSSLVTLADRDEALHPVPLADLAKARGSTFQPFPPRHAAYTFDFSQAHPPRPEDVLASIARMTAAMLEPPITNLGIAGIHKAARRVAAWTSDLAEDQLPAACMNTAVMIDARGGTGGGLFRSMLARYLREAAALTRLPGLEPAARSFDEAAALWQELASLFFTGFATDRMGALLADASRLLTRIAQAEQHAWQLARTATGHCESPAFFPG